MVPAWTHVACCLDQDGREERVLELAVRVARESGARLTLVHGAPRPVIEEEGAGGWHAGRDDPSETARRWLEGLAARAGARAEVLTGTTPATIREWAEQARPDLLVVGASRGPLQRVTVGGFASYLAYHAPCHVLVARPVRGAAAGQQTLEEP